MNLEEKKSKLEIISKQSFLLQNFDKVELFPSKKEEFLGVIKLTKNSVFRKNNYFVVDVNNNINFRKSPLTVKNLMNETKTYMKGLKWKSLLNIFLWLFCCL